MRNSSQDFHKKVLGKQGEKLAKKFIAKAGCKILEVNYVTPFGEADLIARDRETIVFAEVITRTDDSFGRGAEAVTAAKQRRYIKIAQYYLLQHNLTDTNVRFDVIEVEKEGINHIISAFGA